MLRLSAVYPFSSGITGAGQLGLADHAHHGQRGGGGSARETRLRSGWAGSCPTGITGRRASPAGRSGSASGRKRSPAGLLRPGGHDTINVSTALVESGIIKPVEPETAITLNTPAGLAMFEAQDEDVRAAKRDHPCGFRG